MFICCKTKNKRAKQSTHNDSEVRSFSKENHQDEKAQNPDQDRNSKQNSNEANQTEDSHKEILNVVNQIKAYRDLGQVKESVDLEKLFVNGLLAEDLPIVYFIEYRWAIQYTGYLGGMKKAPPKEINNNKILTDDHRTQDTIHITIDNDPQLLPGIQPERHYSLINERAWKFVHLLYGVDPPQLLIQIMQNQSLRKTKFKTHAQLMIKNAQKSSQSIKQTMSLTECYPFKSEPSWNLSMMELLMQPLQLFYQQGSQETLFLISSFHAITLKISIKVLQVTFSTGTQLDKLTKLKFFKSSNGITDYRFSQSKVQLLHECCSSVFVKHSQIYSQNSQNSKIIEQAIYYSLSRPYQTNLGNYTWVVNQFGSIGIYLLIEIQTYLVVRFT